MYLTKPAFLIGFSGVFQLFDTNRLINSTYSRSIVTVKLINFALFDKDVHNIQILYNSDFQIIF